MRQIPIDQSVLGTLVAVGVRPKMVRSDDGEPHQKGNADGIPQWTVETLLRGQGEDASELLNVTVAASEKPSIEGPCIFTGFRAVPWSFNSRSGVAFIADAVAPAGRGGQPDASAKSRAES